MDLDIPTQIEEIVGSDYHQKALQYHSGQGESGGGMYHGQGSSGDSEKKRELSKFFKAINSRLMEKIDVKDEIPLIVASEERSFYLYKDVNSYPFMLDEPIHGNHEETQKDELHQLCLERIPNKMEDALEEAKQQFQHLMNKGESSSEVDKIIGASYYGQVAKLFINENGGLYGHFRPDTNDVNFLEKSTISSADLLNFSAVHTIQKDGQVLLLKEEDMPDPTSPLNAVFRYEVVSS